MNYPLKTRQICFFAIAFLPITKLFMMSSIVASISKEDMWISLLLNVIADFLTLFALLALVKNEEGTLKDILTNAIGEKATKVLLIFYAVYFIIKAIIPFNEQEAYVIQTLYLTMPNALAFLPVFIIPVYLSSKKLRVLGRCADIVWIFTLIGFILIIVLSIGNINLNSLLPVGANNLKNITKGSTKALVWFGDSAYFLFFLGNFKKDKNYRLKILLCFALSLLFVLLFGVIFWCTFTSIAFRQRFALTEISKYMTVINNIGRFDYFAIFLLLFGGVFSLSLPIFFASRILADVFNVKNKYICPIILTAIVCFISIFLNKFFVSIENFLINDAYIIFLIFGNVVPILIGLSTKLHTRRKIYETQ